MVVSQGKRSIHRAQPSSRARAGKNRSKSTRKVIPFPQAKGKVVEGVHFSSDLGYHCITIDFEDKTCLNFAIDAEFTVHPDYSDWGSGNQRILRNWHFTRSLGFRDVVKNK